MSFQKERMQSPHFARESPDRVEIASIRNNEGPAVKFIEFLAIAQRLALLKEYDETVAEGKVRFIRWHAKQKGTNFAIQSAASSVRLKSSILRAYRSVNASSIGAHVRRRRKPYAILQFLRRGTAAST